MQSHVIPSWKQVVTRLVILRIAGALLIGLALCPLVPLLGRPQWPAWVGPFLGALFGVAMFRTKPQVKIAAALTLGFGFNLFRELTNPRIVFLTRWSMPIGFFAGWAVFMILAVLNRRARLAVAIAGLLVIAGIAAQRHGLFAAVHQRYQRWLAESLHNAVVRPQSTSLPSADEIEIIPLQPLPRGSWPAKTRRTG